MGAPGSARLFRVFLSADYLGARSPGRFSGLSHQPVWPLFLESTAPVDLA